MCLLIPFPFATFVTCDLINSTISLVITIFNLLYFILFAIYALIIYPSILLFYLDMLMLGINIY